jgi:hypothetical protein
MKQGLRQMKVAKDKETKKHIKGFYNIMGRMEEIARELDPSIEYTEENIDDYVRPMLGRDLDSMEKFLVLGKMHHTNNIEVKHEAQDNTI